MKLRLSIASLAIVALLTMSAADGWKLPADNAKFRPGRGMELAIANCALCHSADYLSTQPVLSRPAWKATVEKMRLKYGAPITTNKVDAIVDYLVGSYGDGARGKK